MSREKLAEISFGSSGLMRILSDKINPTERFHLVIADPEELVKSRQEKRNFIWAYVTDIPNLTASELGELITKTILTDR